MDPLLTAIIAGSILLLLLLVSWVIVLRSLLKAEKRPESEDLFNEIPEAWVVLDPVKLIAVSANQKALNLFGLFRTENLGKLSFLRMFREDLSLDEANILIQAVDNNTFINKTLEFRSLQNRIFKMVLTVSRIRNGSLLCRFSAPLEQALPVTSDSVSIEKKEKVPGGTTIVSVSPATVSSNPAEEITPRSIGVSDKNLPVPRSKLRADGAAVAILDSGEGFREVNTEFAALTGYTVEELRRFRFYELLNPSDSGYNKHWFRLILEGKVMVSRFERSLLRKDGGRVVLEFMAACLQPEQAVFLTAIDNTEAREEQDRLMESRARLAELFDNTVEVVFSLDNLGRLTEFNHRVEEIFPNLKGRLKPGEEYAALLSAEDAKQWKERQRAVLSGQTLEYRQELSGADFKKIILEVILFPVQDELGLINGLTYTARDITERIKNEELLILARDKAEQATAAKAKFLAVMSHEIRNPLNGLIGVTELLRKTSLNTEQKELVDVIKVSGEALLQVINDILDFSKIEAQKMRLENMPFKLADILNDTVNILSVRAQEKQLMFKAVIGDGVPQQIMGDRARLRQVLLNLAGNAIKFTQKGSVTLLVSVDSGTPNSTAILRFEVRDTGVGIPTERLDELFTDYAQGDDSTYRKFGGTGLGLTICKTLIELMGGRIWAESKIGEGSSFFFTLPAAVVKESVAAEIGYEKIIGPAGSSTVSVGAVHASMNLSGNQSVRILVVDDNDINRLLAGKMFESIGFKVLSFESGKKAYEYLMSNPADLVFMDVQMPEWDGQEATRRIRKAALAGNQPVIIAMTAFSGEEDRNLCLQAGMNDFISKPITISDLEAILLRWLPANENQVGDSLSGRQETISSDNVLLAEPDAVRRLAGLGAGRNARILEKILKLFEQNCLLILGQIRAAADSGEDAEVARHSVRLRAVCQQLGAARMASLCTRLEQNSVLADSSKTARLVRQLSEVFKLTLSELKTIFSQYNSSI